MHQRPFRLLVLATEQTSSDTPFIDLCGSRWVLAEYARLADAPAYTCISYSWGKGRTKNIFEDAQLMSDRTLPAIEATINAWRQPCRLFLNKTVAFRPFIFKKTEKPISLSTLATLLWKSQPLAIWVDVLCVPYQDPARSVCLRSMGTIYSEAARVFAVLSESCSDILCQIRDTDSIDFTDSPKLSILEADDWITRIWTYQEMANSKSIHFIVQGGGNVSITGLDFLHAVVMASTDYMREHKIASFQWAIKYPRLYSIEEMMADHRLADAMGRSAYQVMSAVHQRYSEKAEDKFYAMIGAITTERLDNLDNQLLDPAEYFMRVCEAKGDYSFIYCAAPRSEVIGRCWRPVAGQIPPVISGLLPYGGGQSGHLKESHLQLDNMCRMSFGTVNPNAIKTINAFLLSNNTISSPCDFADAILECLRLRGFSGCGDYLELEDGYFFSQSTLTRSEDIFVAISTDVRWTYGGPGLLIQSNGTDINNFCDVGVFIGRYPKTSESINIG